MATERVTAPLVKKIIDDHLQRHELKIDPKLHDVHEAVFGKGNIGGLCDEVQDIKYVYNALGKDMVDLGKNIAAIKDSLAWVVKIVLGAVILAIIGLIIIP
jgi:hypothetical protein